MFKARPRKEGALLFSFRMKFRRSAKKLGDNLQPEFLAIGSSADFPRILSAFHITQTC
jgi:hypothetical protein